MLNRISNAIMQHDSIRPTVSESRYERNELEDMKKGIEYLYEFKEKLSKLHPNVLDRMEDILQRPRY